MSVPNTENGIIFFYDNVGNNNKENILKIILKTMEEFEFLNQNQKNKLTYI